MTRRSMLFASAARGAFSEAPATSTFALAASPHGGWAGIQWPQATQFGGYTYWSIVNGTTGAVELFATENATRTTGAAIALATYSPDIHNNAALLVDVVTKKLIAVYCSHDASDIFLRRSVNPVDSDPTLSGGFTAEVGLNAQLGGWSDFTYPDLFQLTGEAGSPIVLMYREIHTVGRLAWAKTTDAGTSWSARSILYLGAGSDVPYWNIGSNDVDRIDIFVTDGVGLTGGQKLLHCYYTAGNFRKTDGTLIGAAPTPGADLSMAPANLTLVVDNAAGNVDRAYGACFDGMNPACGAWQWNGSSDRRFLSARWRSGVWQVDIVVNAVGGFLSGNTFQSGARMHPTDPDQAIVAMLVAGRWEQFLATTADDGVSWTLTALTTSSGTDQYNAGWVHNPAAGFAALWCDGSFTDDEHVASGMRGWG